MDVATKIFNWFRSLIIQIKCYCICQDRTTNESTEKQNINTDKIQTLKINKYIIENKREFKLSIK